MSRTSTVIRVARERAGLSLRELAARVGYQNPHRGAERIRRLESGMSRVHPELAFRVGDLLGIAREMIEDAIATDAAAADRAGFAASAARRGSEIRVYVKVAGVPVGLPLPEEVAADDIAGVEAWARAFAAEWRLPVCVTSGTQTVWIKPSGQISGVSEIGDGAENGPLVIHARSNGPLLIHAERGLRVAFGESTRF